MTITLRRAGDGDGTFLTDMLVEAFSWQPARVRPRVELLADPVVVRHVRAWGRPGDAGVIAHDAQGLSVGACWYRVLPKRDGGHGFVAPGVPELTLGVRTPWRAQGIGRALLIAACDLAAEQGHQRISLSVERANFARRLYVEEGFTVVESAGDADTMAKTLR